VHVGGREAELVGDDLRHDRLVALAAGGIAECGAHVAVGLHAHHRGLRGPRGRAAPGHQLVGGEIRARGLHRRRQPDAEQTTLASPARLRLPRARVVEAFERAAQRGGVVAAVVLRAPIARSMAKHMNGLPMPRFAPLGHFVVSTEYAS
jgi:hypothetical protein